jgi:hypothetical protein
MVLYNDADIYHEQDIATSEKKDTERWKKPTEPEVQVLEIQRVRMSEFCHSLEHGQGARVGVL